VSTLLNLLSLAMIALSLVLIVAAPALVAFLAPSFADETRTLAIDLMLAPLSLAPRVRIVNRFCR
jgi:hypothetical protein